MVLMLLVILHLRLLRLVKSSTEDPNTNETPFVVGETVIGQSSKCQLKGCSLQMMVIRLTHMVLVTATLAESYASQTPILNIDMTALQRLSILTSSVMHKRGEVLSRTDLWCTCCC